jgi:hypothetical protein
MRKDVYIFFSQSLNLNVSMLKHHDSLKDIFASGTYFRVYIEALIRLVR